MGLTLSSYDPREGRPQRHLWAWNWAPGGPAQERHICSDRHLPPGGSECQGFLGSCWATTAPTLPGPGVWGQSWGEPHAELALLQHFRSHTQLSSALHEAGESAQDPVWAAHPQTGGILTPQLRGSWSTRQDGGREGTPVSVLYSVLFLDGFESVHS